MVVILTVWCTDKLSMLSRAKWDDLKIPEAPSSVVMHMGVSVVWHITCPTHHLSDASLVRRIACPTHRLSDASLAWHIACPTHRLSDASLAWHIACPTHRLSDASLVFFRHQTGWLYFDISWIIKLLYYWT